MTKGRKRPQGRADVGSGIGTAALAGGRVAFGLLLAAVALPAMAQTESTGTESTGLADIVVTAEKRSENLQNTPLAISAVTADMIERRGIDNVGSLSAIAPNLIIGSTAQSATNPAIFIRGIGESEPILTVDAPNAVYIDGVVLGRSTGSMFDLVDLERIEVLRGPQGTLYGRNTTGGAINIITQRPAHEFGGTLQVGYGEFDLLKMKATVDTGDIGATGLRARFTYLHKQRNGYVKNRLQPDRQAPGAYDVDAFRFSAEYDKGGPFTAYYAYDHSVRHGRAIPAQMAAAAPYVRDYLATSPLLGGAAPDISRGWQDTLSLDHNGPLRDKVEGHNLTLELEINDSTKLRSITGYRSWVSSVIDSGLDGNAGLVGFTISPAILAPPYDFIPEGINPYTFYSGTDLKRQHQWTQEVNLLGNIGETVDYVLGAFYFQEKAQELDREQVGIVLPLGPGFEALTTIQSNLAYRHISRSTALFGQATLHVTPRLDLTGGLRYTWDKRTLHQTESEVVNASAKYGELTWMANAKYAFTDDISAYARVSTGYKSGGFNPRGSSTSFKPEKVTSYEVGVKSELFQNHVRFNIDGFYTRYRDMQVSQFEAGTGGTNTVTVNAGKARYIGVEADLLAQLTRSFSVSGNIGYVSRKFQDYLFLDPETNTLINVAKEARFSYSAAVTANASLDYKFPSLGFGELAAHVDYNYRGRVYWHPLDRLAPFNREISDGPMSTVGARLTLSGVELNGADLTLSLWGKNLTNNHYLLSGIDFGSLGWANVSYAEPRSWGIDATLHF